MSLIKNLILRVVLYLRVSTVEQAKEGYSIGEQEERLRNYCKAMGWEVVKVYIDPGYSGGNTDRPALKELTKDVEAGGIDKVVVYKLDRLSRSQLDTLYLIEKVFLAHGTDFVSMSENFDTSTPFGRAMIGILAVFAQLEREQIRERMGMGKEARAKEGKWCGGSSIPIGYDYDQPNDLFVINEYEAMQYKELVELFLKGTPLRSIEGIFKEKGYRHKHGVWQPITMRKVLRSKIYLGYIKYQKQWYKAEHDPLIDEVTHQRVVALLDQRAEVFAKKERRGRITSYLGGLLYCKHCGSKYAKDSNYRKTADGSYIYHYRCYSRTKKVRSLIYDPNCKNKNWHMVELDNLIFDEIRKLKFDPDYIINAKAEKMKETDASTKIEILKKEIESLNQQISRFMDLYGIGKFTIEQVTSKTDPLNELRSSLEKELESLMGSVGELTIEETMELVNSFDEVLENGDFNEIRLVIESLIQYIELDGDLVTIHWRFA